MKFLLLLGAFTFVLGSVTADCDGDAKKKCIEDSKDDINKMKSPTEKCSRANGVRLCVYDSAKCSENESNMAAKQLSNELKLKCEEDSSWEKTGECDVKTLMCGKTYQEDAKKAVKDETKICQAMEDYENCAKWACPLSRISRNMNIFKKEANIKKCENIALPICDVEMKYESCLNAYNGAIIELDLKKNPDTQCLLTQALERCLRKDAKCDRPTVITTVKRTLDTLDCSEYVDLCDRIVEEACYANHPNIDTCRKAENLRQCLSNNASCSVPRIRHIMSKVLNDNNIDCADIDGCEYTKEESCFVDVSKEGTKEEKCTNFKQLRSCMMRARCNQAYMDKEIEFIKEKLGNPCGSVRAECDGEVKKTCIDNSRVAINKLKSPTDKCSMANGVRLCVYDSAKCSEEESNKAAKDLSDELNLKCEEDSTWERSGKCQIKFKSCENDYRVTINGKKEETEICGAIETFEKCALECQMSAISQKIKSFMTEAGIPKCENIVFPTCSAEHKYETCVNAYQSATIYLNLKEHPVTRCLITQALLRCLRIDAKCDITTVVNTVKNNLDTLDCSEYVNLCLPSEEETCYLSNANPDSCAKLKTLHQCLSKNASCPGPRIHHIMRTAMKDNKIDCADANACEYAKEANCLVDVAKNGTKKEICQRFEKLKPCMERAQCNEAYMNSRIESANKELGNPCGGASSLAISMGLILLLAAVAGQWK